ncbi:MAG: histidinol-phosphatase [Gammaproteobacteria bacterium]
MALALFDLDNTLLGGDSDYLWGRFMVEQGLVDGTHYERENQRFYKQYQDGSLDIHEFLRFALAPLARHDLATLQAWRARYLREKIEPIILPAAQALVERHRTQGDTLVIITATHRFITAPIAALFSVEHLLATEPELIAGRYTGAVSGVPCYREGKVQRLMTWLKEQGLDLGESWFYSDSHNDIALLEQVSHPVAVDPDPNLLRYAQDKGWQVISLRAPA